MPFNFSKFICLLFIGTAVHQNIYAADLPGRNKDRFFPGKEYPYYQDTTIIYTGMVTSESDLPVSGAQVTVGANTVVTDVRGMFSIRANKGSVLSVWYNDILVTTYELSERTDPTVKIMAGNAAWKRAQNVQLLNRITAKPHLTAASTQAVYNPDIVKMPVTYVRAALVGRLAGLYTNQGSGRPGADNVTTTLRGSGSPLLIIDGIPREFPNVPQVFDLNEIESVTVLKDALSTAMLGVRGSSGALLVTTKKGAQAKQQISFTAQTALQQPQKEPKVLGAYDYAQLYNEASKNDGIPARYTEADLEGYRTGSDPYKYPNVNWRDQVLRKSSRFDRYTLDATGGNQFARYYAVLEHFNQTGIFKTVDTNRYNTNNNFKSYVIRSNVEVNITPQLSTGVYLMGRILTGDGPGNFHTNTILNYLLQTPNNAYPVFNPNGSYGGTSVYQDNIWAATTGRGYTQNYKRDILVDFNLKRTLDEVAKGLWIKGVMSYYSNLSENINRSKTVAVFQRVINAATGAETYQQFSSNGIQSNTNFIEYQNRSNYMEATLGYNRSLGSHGIDATVLANRDNYVYGEELPLTFTGISGRVSYNYKEKYVLEGAWGLNGSNRYPDNGATKYGFFPAGGVAWNIHKEDFLKGQTLISNLKLFGSYGKTGWDDPGYFSYIQRYPDAASPRFGEGSGTTVTGIMQGDVVNPDLSFEQAHKLNAGIQGSLFKNKFFFTAEYFNNKFYDLIMRRGRSNAFLGSPFPNENIGQNRYTGWDFQASYGDKTGDFEYYVSAVTGISDSRVLFLDEVSQPYEWMKRTGQRVGQPFGYIAEGLFQSNEEAWSSPTIVGYTKATGLQAGDIKYKDLNGDGIINQFDQAPIGNQKPVITLGADLGFTFKGFDFSALFHGVKNRQIYLSGAGYWAFQNFGGGFGQAYEHHLDRWTPGNASNAGYPRLGLGTNANNQATSSYWYRSGDFVRLKNVVLGYTLPARLTSRVKIKSLRLFVTGTNLYTFSSMDDIDPEVYNGAYPIQRVSNAGITIKL